MVILLLVLFPSLFLLLLSSFGVLFVLVIAVDRISFPTLAGLDLLGCVLVRAVIVDGDFPISSIDAL